MGKFSGQVAFLGASEVGYVLATIFTIDPATTDVTKHRDITLVITLAVITFIIGVVVLWVNYQHDEKFRTKVVHDVVEAVKAVSASATTSEAGPDVAAAADIISEIQDSATATVTPAKFKIDLFSLGEADKAAELAGNNTVAAKLFQALPRPVSLRQQAFDLVNAAREAVKQYHGPGEIDSFVSPEIRKAFTEPLLAVKNKIQKFLHRDVLRKAAKFPVTVTRFRMFLDDIELAVADLKEDIPPVV